MTQDTCNQCHSANSSVPGGRKRMGHDLHGDHGQVKVSKVANPVKPSEEACKVSNDGWGDLFKNKETFVDMHIC